MTRGWMVAVVAEVEVEVRFISHLNVLLITLREGTKRNSGYADSAPGYPPKKMMMVTKTGFYSRFCSNNRELTLATQPMDRTQRHWQ
jgi:hypothetical protein